MSINRYSSTVNRRHLQHGVSLVEIMVGVLIALIGIVIIFQMLANSEARKRSATSGSDVQVSGTISMTALERDVREAGYGFSSAAYDTSIPLPLAGTAQNVAPVMGCTVQAYDVSRPTPAYTFLLTPVQIVQGAGSAPDTIIVLRGNSPVFPAAYVFTESTNTTKKTRGRSGLFPRDYALVARTSPSLNCQLIEITEVNDDYGTCGACTDALTIQHKQGNYSYVTYLPNNVTQVDTRIARYNNAAPPAAFTNGWIFNLGNGARRNIWTVSANNTLQVTNDLMYLDVNPADGVNDAVTVTEGVINMQAEYGIDANNNGRIEASEWVTAPPGTTAGWANVIAVRVAILLRSGQYERPTGNSNVTTAANFPIWSGNANSPLLVTNLDGSPSAAAPASGQEVDDWRNYRYRIYESVIPLRNILWGSGIKP